MRIGELIKNSKKPFFSLEFFPPAKTDQLPEFYQTVQDLGKFNPLFVSVTYGAGGKKQQNTLETTSELARQGFTVMAHLTCTGATPEGIEAFINKLLAADVDNILALRGDAPKDTNWDWNSGYFHHASDLVAFARAKFPQLGIGVAVYPAPHPESRTFSEDRRHTAAKLKAGADFAVTQLFFDIREYMELLERLRKAGVDKPVIPGILPVQSLESVKRIVSLCGANVPGKMFFDLQAAHEQGGAQAVRETGFEFAIRQIHDLLACGAPGIHIYTLNKSNLCKRIITESGLA